MWCLESLAVREIIWPIIRKRLHHQNVFAWLFGLTILSVKWFHTCCYWMSTKRLKILVLECPWHNYSKLLPQTPVLSHFSFPMTVKRPTSLLTLHLVFTQEKKQYFEYDACWTRCLNQIYENTNLHLLSVWRGFPYRNMGLGFPKPKLEVQYDSEIIPNQSVLYDSQPLTTDMSCLLFHVWTWKWTLHRISLLKYYRRRV